MGYIDLENQLSQKRRKTRIILALCVVISLVLFFFGIGMREASKEVTVHDYVFFQRESVTYNNNWFLLILPAIIAFIYLSAFLIVDLVLCHFKTFEKDNQHITVYRGMSRSVVYVDGNEVGKIEPLSYEYVIETKLLSGVKVIISFPRRRSLLIDYVHVSFSDNTPSLEL